MRLPFSILPHLCSAAHYLILDLVYANSFLATLNTRRVLRGRGTDAETNTMPTFLMVGKLTRPNLNHFADHVYPPPMSPTTKDDYYPSQPSVLEIGIEQEVTVTRDSVRLLSQLHVAFAQLTSIYDPDDSLRRRSITTRATLTVTIRSAVSFGSLRTIIYNYLKYHNDRPPSLAKSSSRNLTHGILYDLF